LALAGTGFELIVRDLATLRPHEETIPAHVERMARELHDDGVQKDPILIDGRSGTVLDGMHRLAAFASLGFDRAVCCSLDYGTEKVTVGRWARVYEAGDIDQQRKVFADEGFTKPMDLVAAVGALEKREVSVTVALGDGAFVQDRKPDLAGAFRTVERIDQASSDRGWRRSFAREEEIQEQASKGDRAVLLVERLLKKDVFEAARTGRLFPCKTSMHTIDPRPVAVNFPLSELKENGRNPQHKLMGREARLLPPGSTYEGRRYKERLLLLNPS
jgi:hypothetical protein